MDLVYLERHYVKVIGVDLQFVCFGCPYISDILMMLAAIMWFLLWGGLTSSLFQK